MIIVVILVTIASSEHASGTKHLVSSRKVNSTSTPNLPTNIVPTSIA